MAKGTKLGIGEAAVVAGDMTREEPAAAALPIVLEGAAVRETPMLALSPISLEPVQAGKAFEVAVDLTIAEGHHVQPHKPKDREAFATVARLRGDVTLASQEWAYPAASPDSQDGGSPGYSGKVRIIARCVLAKNTAPGRYTLRATVLAQPCSGTSCFPPEKVSVDFPLAVLPA